MKDYFALYLEWQARKEGHACLPVWRLEGFETCIWHDMLCEVAIGPLWMQNQ